MLCFIRLGFEFLQKYLFVVNGCNNSARLLMKLQLLYYLFISNDILPLEVLD